MVDTIKHRVSGAFLADNVGKQVIILGTVLQVHGSGTSFDIKTTDDRVVSVKSTVQVDSSLHRLVEVHGTATGRNAVLCQKVIEFPTELVSDFDAEGYNEALNIINSVPNMWRPTEA